MFNGSYYKQVDGVAMGSPLGPTLANAFMCYHEQKWLEECPLEFKPTYYRRYVDDIFVMFSKPEHLDRFFDYLNSRHNSINFTKEKEQNNSLSFLDVLVSRIDNRFETGIYRKTTFSGVFTNFNSFIPTAYKHGLIYSLLFRCFRICSSFSKFHDEIVILREIFDRNDYPCNVIDFCVRNFLAKIHRPKVEVFTVPKRDINILLPFLGTTSLKIRTQLQELFKRQFPQYELRIIFKAGVRFRNLFHFKDKIPKLLQSGLVYRFKCSGCNATYYGKTKRHFKVRMCEHLGISHLTGKRKTPQAGQSTAILEHTLFCRGAPSFSDFDILARDTNDFKLTLKESLLIARDKPLLNRTVQSMPLELF